MLVPLEKFTTDLVVFTYEDLKNPTPRILCEMKCRTVSPTSYIVKNGNLPAYIELLEKLIALFPNDIHTILTHVPNIQTLSSTDSEGTYPNLYTALEIVNRLLTLLENGKLPIATLQSKTTFINPLYFKKYGIPTSSNYPNHFEIKNNLMLRIIGEPVYTDYTQLFTINQTCSNIVNLVVDILNSTTLNTLEGSVIINMLEDYSEQKFDILMSILNWNILTSINSNHISRFEWELPMNFLLKSYSLPILILSTIHTEGLKFQLGKLQKFTSYENCLTLNYNGENLSFPNYVERVGNDVLKCIYENLIIEEVKSVLPQLLSLYNNTIDEKQETHLILRHVIDNFKTIFSYNGGFTTYCILDERELARITSEIMGIRSQAEPYIAPTQQPLKLILKVIDIALNQPLSFDTLLSELKVLHKLDTPYFSTYASIVLRIIIDEKSLLHYEDIPDLAILESILFDSTHYLTVHTVNELRGGRSTPDVIYSIYNLLHASSKEKTETTGHISLKNNQILESFEETFSSKLIGINLTNLDNPINTAQYLLLKIHDYPIQFINDLNLSPSEEKEIMKDLLRQLLLNLLFKMSEEYLTDNKSKSEVFTKERCLIILFQSYNIFSYFYLSKFKDY